MKRFFWWLIGVGFSLYVISQFVGVYQTVGRGQKRLTLARKIAQYLVENEYVFPDSWNDFEDYYYFKRYGKRSHSKHNSVLHKLFVLPWGESLTNHVVLTRCWFKSIDRERTAEDIAFTRVVLFDVLSLSTNSVVDNAINSALGGGAVEE